MVKKIKKKKSKQDKKRISAQERIQEEMAFNKRAKDLASLVNLEKKVMFVDCALAIAWTLRQDHHFGKKRLIDFLDRYLDVTLDWRSGRYYDREMMLETLQQELGFDFETYMVEQMKNHVDKLMAWELEEKEGDDNGKTT